MEYFAANLPYAAALSLVNLCYFPLNLYLRNKKPQHSVRMAWDEALPHVTLFYIPYALSLLLITLGPFLFGYFISHNFYRPLWLSLMINLISSFIIWMLYPCKIHASDKVQISQLPIWGKIVKNYGNRYGNSNSFPSAHVSLVTLYLAWLCLYVPHFLIAWILLAVINFLSVLFTHQHYLLDAIAGLVQAVVIFATVFVLLQI